MNHYALSISGSGGAGALTVGNIILQAVAKAGFYGLLTHSSGPQIRGGESAVMLHLADTPIEAAADRTNCHLALDWQNFDRFHDEILLDQNSWVIFDISRETCAESVIATQAKISELTLHTEIRALPGSRANGFAIGILAAQLGLDPPSIEAALIDILGKKHADALAISLQAIERGRQLLPIEHPILKDWIPSLIPRWNISGNEACGLGALRAGIQFVAAYPITPATDIVEFLAARIEKMGGCLMIAEDELAAVNMAIGASFGGNPSMTATSGPGLSLMTEAMGLAVASETPLVVVNVMRGGPSTGIPTKSEQTDLNQALFGLHGEAPHLVLAPNSIADQVLTMQWAVGLAEQLQTLAIVLSDQYMGQARAIIAPLAQQNFELKRLTTQPEETEDYQRYERTPDALSPMSRPGLVDGEFTADGLEHTSSGIPSSMATDHTQQLTKRQQKLLDFDFGSYWSEQSLAQDAQLLILSWGSSKSACQRAIDHLKKQGIAIDHVNLRLLMPLQITQLQTLCHGKQVIVVEQSFSKQFFHYLLGQQAIPQESHCFAQEGPLMIRTPDLVDFILNIHLAKGGKV